MEATSSEGTTPEAQVLAILNEIRASQNHLRDHTRKILNAQIHTRDMESTRWLLEYFLKFERGESDQRHYLCFSMAKFLLENYFPLVELVRYLLPGGILFNERNPSIMLDDYKTFYQVDPTVAANLNDQKKYILQMVELFRECANSTIVLSTMSSKYPVPPFNYRPLFPPNNAQPPLLVPPVPIEQSMTMGQQIQPVTMEQQIQPVTMEQQMVYQNPINPMYTSLTSINTSSNDQNNNLNNTPELACGFDLLAGFDLTGLEDPTGPNSPTVQSNIAFAGFEQQ